MISKSFEFLHLCQYGEVTEDIFAMSYMRIFEETEKKKMGDVYTLLCLAPAELSKAFGLINLCYSKISVVMLVGFTIALISRKFESEQKKMSCPKMLHI